MKGRGTVEVPRTLITRVVHPSALRIIPRPFKRSIRNCSVSQFYAQCRGHFFQRNCSPSKHSSIPAILDPSTRHFRTASSHHQGYCVRQQAIQPIAVLVGICSSLVLFGLYIFHPHSSPVRPQNMIPDTAKLQAAGSTTEGEALPGRPGSLTLEQEEKLKEFWSAALHVFGVVPNTSAAEVHRTGEASPEAFSKKPKKRVGLFRSRKTVDHAASETLPECKSHSSAPADADDKHGQTKDFHEALASLTPESLRDTFWAMVKHDHPDALLLRFLRARKWDVEKALVMMVSTMKWRSAGVHLDDDIMKRGEFGAIEDLLSEDPAKKKIGGDFLAQIRLGKSFIHGHDSMGRPCSYVRVRLHKAGEQSEESLERFTIYTIESARMLLAPPVDTACIVFDMTGFSLANMDYTPVKFMIKCFEANYPESLGVVLVHKAPWVFQGIWRVIKGWLDPVVASKVNFTKDIDELKNFIPLTQLPKEMGGQEDWTYEYIEPLLGENDRMSDTTKRDEMLAVRGGIIKEYEQAVIEWIENPSADAAKLQTQRHDIAIRLKNDYWRLDPYLRARSYLDRVGMIPAYRGSGTLTNVQGGHID